MTDDTTCPVCQEATKGLSPVSTVANTEKLNWEHDSTMKLLGLPRAAIQLRFCTRCFHSAIFPKFEASQLYGSRGAEVRKEIYESYFPGKSYGETKTNFNLSTDFANMSREFARLHRVAAFVAANNKDIFSNIEEIRLLDWGGGDGYLSAAYANILSVVSGLKATHFVYDYTDWGGAQSHKVGIEDLKNMDPFQIVLFSHVLEHTYDPVGTIKAALPYLAEEGLTIVEVPDERPDILAQVVRRKKFGFHYHVHHFSRRSLHRVFELAGLGNIHTAYQLHSSYRGMPIDCIRGLARKKCASPKQRRPWPFWEYCSVLLMFARKIIRKILRVVFSASS